MTRTFHLGEILSVTTGVLVAPGHIAAVHELLDFMTGDALFTHQLPRAFDECKPELLRQHPDLADIKPAEFEKPVDVVPWLAAQVERFGEFRVVAPLQQNDHTRINPLDELAMNYPHVTVITVQLPEETP